MTTTRLALLTVFASALASGDYAADKKKYDACVAKVKKDYPVPNGNANTQRQMIQMECGNPPTPPKN